MKVDLAFGSVWLTQNHNEFVNMSTPWIEMFMHFLVPRPQSITNFWALTRPFTVQCWILVIIMLFVKSMYMYIRARIDPKFPKRKLISIMYDHHWRSKTKQYIIWVFLLFINAFNFLNILQILSHNQNYFSSTSCIDLR